MGKIVRNPKGEKFVYNKKSPMPFNYQFCKDVVTHEKTVAPPYHYCIYLQPYFLRYHETRLPGRPPCEA